jgi:hypothetical protein
VKGRLCAEIPLLLSTYDSAFSFRSLSLFLASFSQGKGTEHVEVPGVRLRCPSVVS